MYNCKIVCFYENCNQFQYELYPSEEGEISEKCILKIFDEKGNLKKIETVQISKIPFQFIKRAKVVAEENGEFEISIRSEDFKLFTNLEQLELEGVEIFYGSALLTKRLKKISLCDTLKSFDFGLLGKCDTLEDVVFPQNWNNFKFFCSSELPEGWKTELYAHCAGIFPPLLQYIPESAFNTKNLNIVKNQQVINVFAESFIKYSNKRVDLAYNKSQVVEEEIELMKIVKEFLKEKTIENNNIFVRYAKEVKEFRNALGDELGKVEKCKN